MNNTKSKVQWKVSETSPTFKTGDTQFHQLIKHGSGHIAIAYGETPFECNANAKLIAAAPELLEFCQSYIDSLLNKDYQEKWLEKYGNDKEANHLLIAAFKLIKQATN